LLALNGGHSNYIGIDLGATHIIGILTDLNTNTLDRIFFNIRPGLGIDLILNQMEIILKNLSESEKTTAEIKSIGICVPGFVMPKMGLSVISENIPGWKNINLKEIFEKKFNKTIFLEDSSRTLGLAEKYLGYGKKKNDFIVLDIGYGIGMALFIKGKLYTGSSYKSGEIGHTIVKVDGPECVCGNRGCLETVASGKAIATQASEGMKTNESKILHELTHGKADSVTAQDVSIAASMGDAFSKGLLTDAGKYIGVALANAVNIFNPSAVIIGGGMVAAGNLLLDSLIESLKINTMMGIIDDLEIFVSNLGTDGSALGSSILAMQPLFAYNDIHDYMM
jgi:N-acetylglucosamine repressor